MSRSRRKTPVIGNTSAESEKEDKQMYNRRFRHAFKQFLIIADDSKPEPSLRELSNPWSMDKDGKNRFDPSEFPYLLWK
ncbi:MAG: hypothetical protein JNL64_00730 [Blastocatellia bacterium]|nr:hypothetical protein [Blastocatellia bacterium]